MPPLPDDLQELSSRAAADPNDVDARRQLGEGLIELGEVERGIAELFAAAEALGLRSEFQAAIDLLNRLLEEDPSHAPAHELRGHLFQQVPRQRPGPPDGDLGARLFRLPASSAAVLSRMLPFDEEDPPAVAGDVVVPLPPGAAESPSPLLATLDRELRRGNREPTGQQRAVATRPHQASAEVAADAPAVGGDRISPAARALTVEGLAPNPVIDVLDTKRLERLLTLVDLIRYEAGDIVFDVHTRTRALYVVVQGQLHVQRDIEERGHQTVDVLEPGDFFGEFELLTVTATQARIVAAESALVLEIPDRIVREIAERHPEVEDFLWDAFYRRAFHSLMATSAIFSELPVAVINRIASELEPLLFEMGDIVLREGEVPDGLYGVVGGSLAVIRPSESPGRIVTRLGPGDFFGLVSAASGGRSRASVVALEHATLVWLPAAALTSLREGLPAFEAALTEASQSRTWRYKLAPLAG